jgi:hypothetical protein
MTEKQSEHEVTVAYNLILMERIACLERDNHDLTSQLEYFKGWCTKLEAKVNAHSTRSDTEQLVHSNIVRRGRQSAAQEAISIFDTRFQLFHEETMNELREHFGLLE